MTLGKEFAAALVAMQGQLKQAEKTQNNEFFKKNGKATPYADLSSCWEACKEALQANKIAVLQPIVDAPAGFVGIRTVLVYGPTGETFGETYAVPLKDATNPQAMGSAITYGRRYGLCSVLGISPAEDDGNSAAGNSTHQRPKAKPPVEASAVLKAFEEAKDLPGRTKVYEAAKSANIQEPSKTQLLAKMKQAIDKENK